MDILLIEDDPTISAELQLRWQARGWRVRALGTLGEASRLQPELRPDVIVLDLQLPDGDGLDWMARWRRQSPATPVLVLTARDQVADRVEGLRRGADDYLVKPFAPAELDARLESLCRRSGALQGARLQLGDLQWQRDEGRALVHGRPLELHPREFEVLGLLMRRAPGLVAKRVLAEALAERNLELGDGAVEVYVSRLRRKLRGAGVAIQTARGFGYRLVLDEGDGGAGELGEAGPAGDEAAAQGDGEGA